MITDPSNIRWICEGCMNNYESSTTVNKVHSSGNEIFFTCIVNCENIKSLIIEFHNILKNCLNKDNILSSNADIIPKIILYIDSPGGLIKDCFKFIDFIKIMKKNYKFELTTICCGGTASAATLIAIIGDKRYVTQLCIIMIHELFGGAIGSYT